MPGHFIRWIFLTSVYYPQYQFHETMQCKGRAAFQSRSFSPWEGTGSTLGSWRVGREGSGKGYRKVTKISMILAILSAVLVMPTAYWILLSWIISFRAFIKCANYMINRLLIPDLLHSDSTIKWILVPSKNYPLSFWQPLKYLPFIAKVFIGEKKTAILSMHRKKSKNQLRPQK